MHSYVGFVQAEGKLIGSISLLEVERIDSVGNDELVAAIEDVGEDVYQYVCGRGLCWCDRVNGYGSRHSNSCQRLRKLLKAAKGRSK